MTFEPYLAPYARTLLEVAQEKGELDVVRQEVEALLGIFAAEPRLQLLLESPRVEEHEKLGVVDAVFAGKCNETLYRFLRLVVDKGRSEGLRDMLDLFLAEHDRLSGRVNVEVTTAVPPTRWPKLWWKICGMTPPRSPRIPTMPPLKPCGNSLPPATKRMPFATCWHWHAATWRYYRRRLTRTRGY